MPVFPRGPPRPVEQALKGSQRSAWRVVGCGPIEDCAFGRAVFDPRLLPETNYRRRKKVGRRPYLQIGLRTCIDVGITKAPCDPSRLPYASYSLSLAVYRFCYSNFCSFYPAFLNRSLTWVGSGQTLRLARSGQSLSRLMHSLSMGNHHL
jgi:hypothetical protein